MKRNLLIGVACLLGMCSLAFAYRGHVSDAYAHDTNSIFFEAFRPGETREEYLASILPKFRENDRDSDGLDQQDIESYDKQLGTRSRASEISDLLQHDYNGDLTVTRSEIKEYAKGDAKARKKTADDLLEDFDTNGDGTATIKEAIAKASLRKSTSLAALLEADSNGDGRVTKTEFINFALATFDSFDSDRNEVLSRKEYDIALEIQEIREAGCIFPKSDAQTNIVGFGANEGDAISSAYIGDPDEETSVIHVTIEEGDQPLYLLFTSSQPVIWQIHGDINRVEHVIASSGHDMPLPSSEGAINSSSMDLPPQNREGAIEYAAVGVTGVPKSKVSITSSTCLEDLRPEKGGSYPEKAEHYEKMKEARIKAIIDRPLDTLSDEYSPFGVKLPSGTTYSAPPHANARPKGFDAQVWEEAASFWSGGLIRIDPANVVATLPVKPYRVLPSQMGLAQLVGSGAAQRLDDHRFLIKRDIARIPPGMSGAHSAVLVLADGVNPPPGDPSHGCVVTQAQAKKVKNIFSCPYQSLGSGLVH